VTFVRPGPLVVSAMLAAAYWQIQCRGVCNWAGGWLLVEGMNSIIRYLLIAGAVVSALIAVTAGCWFVPASRTAATLRTAAARSRFDSAGEEMDILNASIEKLKQANALTPDARAEAVQSARERARQSDAGKLAESDRLRADAARMESHWLAIEFLGACIWLAVCCVGLCLPGPGRATA
jgi:hypothetical protein